MVVFRWLIALCAAILVTCASGSAWAYPGEGSGYPSSGSWNSPIANACANCHLPPSSGPNAPTVFTINGNSLMSGTPEIPVEAGSTTRFTVAWTTKRTDNLARGGFAVMHNDSTANNTGGLLRAVDANTVECLGNSPSGCLGTANSNTELVHKSQLIKSGSTFSFRFDYTAPTNVCDTFTFRVVINDTDGGTGCYDNSDWVLVKQFTVRTTCPDDNKDCTNDSCVSKKCTYPLLGSGVQCRAAAPGTTCDKAEFCTGSSPDCPSNSFQPNGTSCRAASDDCDEPEFCTGSSATCPSDQVSSSSKACHPNSNGGCDVTDFCNGSSKACPADSVVPANTVCRAAGGPCGLDEVCNGVSKNCPSDQVKGSGTSCRDPSCSAGTATLGASCNGVTTTCPALQTVQCAPNTCDASGLACSGGCASDANCTAGNYCGGGLCTAKKPNGNSCGASNECSSNNCIDGVCCNSSCGGGDPNDCRACNVAGSVGQCVPRPSSDTCRASLGACDPAEKCDGTSNACPADARLGKGAECRGKSDTCDVAEVCDGTSPICPTDLIQASGTPCRDAPLICDSPEVCDGVNKACPPDKFLPSTTTCRLTVGACDVTEFCTGTAAACPRDTLRNSGDICGAASCTDGVADPVQKCTGSSAACPAPTPVDCDPYVCGIDACLGDCSSDVHCIPEDYCSAGKCIPKIPQGGTCTTDNQCVGGRCVDGFCCDSRCTDQCEACNLAGKEGTCSAVSGDPVGTRPGCQSDGSMCGGSCDGVLRRACSFPGTGESCRPASCANGVATLGAFCNARGACPPAFEQQCPGGSCSGTSCGDECALDSDCTLQQFCSAGACVAKQPQGEACPSDAACISGVCVDGFCCNAACAGQCEACDVAGSEGKCSPVTGAPHGARTACTTDGSACAGACDGTDAAGCAYPDTGTACRSPSCTKGVATLAATCSGDGRCPAVQQQACTPNACSGTACGGASACTTNAQCGIGKWCAGGVCVLSLNVGERCANDAQCGSTLCVDGFCCTQPCNGQCEACDLPGKEGSCDVVPSGLPHGGRDACRGLGPCGGECRGQRDVCGFPNGTSACGRASCEGGVQSFAATCNGAGTCIGSSERACGNYACGDDACLNVCEHDEDCTKGAKCTDGECLVPIDMVDPSNGGAGGEAPQANGGDGGSKGMQPSAGGAGDGPAPGAGGTNGDGTDPDGMNPDGTDPDGMNPDGEEPSSGTKDDGGCGCRAAGARGNNAGAALLLLVLAAGARRRRAHQPKSAARRLAARG